MRTSAQLIGSKPNNLNFAHFFLHYLTVHDLVEHLVNVSEIIYELLGAACGSNFRLNHNNGGAHAVKLAAENYPWMIFINQSITEKLAHIFRLFNIESSGLFINVFCSGRSIADGGSFIVG